MKVIVIGNDDDFYKVSNLLTEHSDFKDIEIIHQDSDKIVCDVETLKDHVITHIESKQRGVLVIGGSYGFTSRSVVKNNGDGVYNTIGHLDEDAHCVNGLTINRFDSIVKEFYKPITNSLTIPDISYSDFESGKERRRKRRKSNRKR